MCDVSGVSDTSGSLTVWHVNQARGLELLESVATEFERRFPAIDVELVNVSDFGGPIGVLRTGLPAPDVMLMGQDGMVNLPDSGRVTSASACMAADRSFEFDDLLPAVRTANSVDDVVWSMPFLVSTPVIYFDRNRYRAAGLDPDDAPDDLVELREQLEVLLDEGGAAKGLISGSPQWYVSVWAADLGVELADDAGRTALGPMVFDLDHDELIDRLNQLSALAAAGLVTDIDLPDYADLLELVSPTAPAAMVAHTSGSMRDIYAFIEGGASPGAEVGVFPFPHSADGTVLGGTNAWLMAPPEREAAAWAFMEDLASTATQARAGAIGYVPARLSSLDDPTLQQEWAARPGLRVPTDVVLGIIPESRHLGWVAGPEATVRWRLAQAGRDILGGRPPLEVLARAQTDIARVLQAYHDLRAQATTP